MHILRGIIEVDWNDTDSIQKAEAKKTRLENAGYKLVSTSAGLVRSRFWYERASKENSQLEYILSDCT